MNNMYEYPVKEGDIVSHYRDYTLIGVVKLIDYNLPHPTTCTVLWSGDNISDIQWTNKLVVIENEQIRKN